jgi:retinol dehydrogenase 12
MTGELSRVIEESVPNKPRVVINSVNPGFCNTDIWRNAPWPIKLVLSFFGWLFGRSPEVGARTLMFAMLAGEESQGKYTGDCMIRDPSPLVCSKEGWVMGRKAYAELLGILESIVPGIRENV